MLYLFPFLFFPLVVKERKYRKVNEAFRLAEMEIHTKKKKEEES